MPSLRLVGCSHARQASVPRHHVIGVQPRHEGCSVAPCSTDVYLLTPEEVGDNETGFTAEPLYHVKVLSKATNKAIRSFRVPYCTVVSSGQPVMVP